MDDPRSYLGIIPLCGDRGLSSKLFALEILLYVFRIHTTTTKGTQSLMRFLDSASSVTNRVSWLDTCGVLPKPKNEVLAAEVRRFGNLRKSIQARKTIGIVSCSQDHLFGYLFSFSITVRNCKGDLSPHLLPPFFPANRTFPPDPFRLPTPLPPRNFCF